MTGVNDFVEEGTDLADPVSDNSVADHVLPEEGQAESEPQSAPKYLTEEDFERMWQEREGNIIQRASQSATDKVQARIEQRFKALEETSKTLGLSEEQVERAKEKIYREEIVRRPVDEATSTPAVQTNNGGAGAVNPVEQVMSAAFDVGGAVVLPTDPEGAEIDAALRDPAMTPEKLQAVTLKASMAKAARTAKQAESARLQSPTGGAGSASRSMEALTKQLKSLQAQEATPKNLAERKKVLAEMKKLDK